MGISRLNPSEGGIPYGNTAGRPANPGIGRLYSNGELQRLELYTGASYGWQNIVAETPGVTGYAGTVVETNLTNTITITGTNFISGATATLIGSDGTEIVSNTTTVSNLTSIIATFGVVPANIEPYDIRVTNPSNLYGVYYDILTVNDKPAWTAAGSLGSFNEGSSVSISALATDEENNSFTFALVSGSLPDGLSLNTSTGTITGTASGVSSTTTYNFTISASDGINTAQTRAFSITINSILTWNTSAGSLGTVNPDVTTSFSYTLSATALSNTITYSIDSGSLPSGLTLNSSTGVISGTVNAFGATSNFSVLASDGTISSSRSFSITVGSPTSSGGLTIGSGGYKYHLFTSGSATFSSTINRNIEVLVVGGGGAGDNDHGGGGGAGGVLYHPGKSITAGTSYSVSIGEGGSANNGIPLAGSNTVFDNLTAYGGGRGSTTNADSGGAGGSGGGGGGANSGVATRAGGGATQTSMNGATGYGNAGGTGGGTNGEPGGGGGGAGQAGGNSTADTAGKGGNGLNTWAGWLSAISSLVSGTTQTVYNSGYIAGGGGGGHTNGNTGNSGGLGGGGNGGLNATTGPEPFSGVPNTGGGGGSHGNGGTNGGNGGSGVVIVRFAI
jgi:hypothetical protein